MSASTISRLRAACVSAACALGMAGATAPAAAQPAPEPGLPMWVVRDADSTIYITGTIHMLRDDMHWRSAKLDAALAEAGELWLEVAEVSDPDALAAKLQSLLPTYAANDGPPLSALLTDQENTDLAAALKAAGAPEEIVASLDRYQPWLAIYSLGRDRTSGMGDYKTDNGIDVSLAQIARERGIPVKGMEDVEVQVALMATASVDQQLARLREILSGRSTNNVQGKRLADLAFGSWIRGEVHLAEAMMVFMQIGSSATGVSTDPMFKNRNEAWAGVIEDMLKGSGVSFIAVGAGHLVGADSLQARLKLRGISAERY
jgi:uncharacterized protein YbaP (TraB family)